MISLNVEDVVVVAHVIDGVEGLLHIRQGFPISGLDDCVPFIESRSCAGMLKAKLIENGFGDNDH